MGGEIMSVATTPLDPARGSSARPSLLAKLVLDIDGIPGCRSVGTCNGCQRYESREK